MSFWDKRAEVFYDEWESAGSQTREDRIRANLSDYVNYARRLSFYRDRLSPYDEKNDFPLKKVPPLEPKVCRSELPPLGSGLITGSLNECNVFQSGGTTGIPKTSLFTHEELEGLNLPNTRGFFALGLKPEDRVAGLWASGSLYMTFIHLNRMLQQYGCMNFPFANHSDPRFIHSVTRQFQINCLTGVASSILELGRRFSEYGLEGIKIEKIYYGAEHFYEADKRELREKLGATIIAAPGYGTVDTWYLGYQCLTCPTGVFHSHDDQAYLEIVDETDGSHCGPEKSGMLYVTAFCRKLTPIVRYRVGDRAKWLAEPCPCGRTTPLFRLLGRGDDVLRIGYDSVDYNSVQDAAEKVPGLTGTLQIEKQRESGRDRLIVRIETELLRESREAAAEAFRRQFLNLRPSLAHLIEKGSVWPVEVECCRPNTLTRNPKTGKLIRVIDVMSDL